MSPEPDGPTPPEGLPEHVSDALADLDGHELRKAIVHAQELLRAAEETELPIEPGPGEDILRTTEHDEYTEVVKTVTCAEGCEDCPHGPYLYHVTEEPRPEGGEHTHWKFMGDVHEEE
jgi:hypothetical protein